MNDFLLEMLLKDNELAEKNRGQILEKLDLTSWVESERIESSSKQAIKKGSTRLVSSLIFDQKQGKKRPLLA